jgi:MFS family permease
VTPPSVAAARRRALWPGVAALVAVMGIGRFVYTPILPEMLADGALSLREAGWVASANFVGYLVGAMVAARIVDPGAQSRFARAGLVATALTLVAMAATGGAGAWMAIRFASGVASAIALVFVSTQVVARLGAIGETDRTIVLFAGVGIGIAASAVTTQAVLAAGGSWRAAWTAAAVMAAAFGAYAWSGAGPAVPTPTAPSTASAAPPTAPAPRAVAATTLAYGLFGLGYVIHATYLPAMVRAAGYPPSAAAWVWVLVGLVSLPSIAAWRAVSRRFGARAAIAGCYAVEGVTALVPLAGDSIAWAAIAAAGLGATFIPITGLALPFARSLDPARASRAIGTMTAAFGAGQIVGPVAAAYLAEGRGFSGPSILACVVLLSAAVVMAPRRDAAS